MRRPSGSLLLIALLMPAAGCSRSRFVTADYEQTYLAADHNREFRNRFPGADQLFNGFDYGHAILYETLLTRSNAVTQLDGPTFGFVTTQVLRHPPLIPLEEHAVGPHYATLIPEVVAMFEWAHMLHRQLYDIWARPGWTPAQRDREVKRAVAYYRSRRDLAFSMRPKSMSLMEDQPYSRVFRAQAPKFNGLLWSYHWMQMALYDALMVDTSAATQSANVNDVVRHFFAMIDDAPRRMPEAMPMSAGVAPLFSDRYPDAAIIFDNLHALHDVVSDVLLSPVIPRDRKRLTILHAAAAYRDDTTAVISVEEWRAMSRMMEGMMSAPTGAGSRKPPR